MQYITVEDMDYLASQSTDKINMILAGMTSLMSDTDIKVEALENQKWYQRMGRTITGKNKATRAEIQHNGEKLNAYMSEAIAELYNRGCIEERMILSLGNQLNELYMEHIQLKVMLGQFVSKLNEKIESVDNFHIVNTEIEQGVYSESSNIVAVCQILGQIDSKMLLDTRKMGIIVRSMEKQNILSNSTNTLKEYLIDIINTSMIDIGIVYMELNSLKDNFIAKVMVDIIENYHLLSDMTKMMKNKESVVDKVIFDNQLEPTAELSIETIFNAFCETKEKLINGFKIQDDELIEENEEYSEEKNSEQDCEYTEEKIKEMYEFIIEHPHWDYGNEIDVIKNEYEEIFKGLNDSKNVYVCYYLGKLLHKDKIFIECDEGILNTKPWKKWYWAAEQGYVPAQYELGTVVLKYIGCQGGDVIAHYFYDIPYDEIKYERDNRRLYGDVKRWLKSAKENPEYKLLVEQFEKKNKFTFALVESDFGDK